MLGVHKLKKAMAQAPTSQALTHLQAVQVMRHMLIVLGWLRRLTGTYLDIVKTLQI